MDSERGQTFRYLDSEADRQALVADMHRVRQTVISLAEAVPQERHFEPRYHGWTLAALLAHLNMMDRIAMIGIQLALLGIRPPLSPVLLDKFNDRTARIFRQRRVAATIRGINQYEERIADFVMTLPIDRFTREVYYPPTESYLTIEKALQQYFLFHWQEHLQTLQRGEGIFYEPPESTTEI